MKVAALFVDPASPYHFMEDVECWGEESDARTYLGNFPVVAHPPCERWGKFFWRGKRGARATLGDDQGCFLSALVDVERCGGVLEHPEGSAAWPRYGLVSPEPFKWVRSRAGWVASVDQALYGHRAIKRTWVYYVGPRPSPKHLNLDRAMFSSLPVEHMGHEERRLTPPKFAEALVRMARRSLRDRQGRNR